MQRLPTRYTRPRYCPAKDDPAQDRGLSLRAAMIGAISGASPLLPSSSGPGRRPLTAKTWVRVP
jgi:hypothetical protein